MIRSTLVFFLFINTLAFAQNSDVEDVSSSIRFMFYNVENLFDTRDDSLKRDESFTPEGSNRWNWYRMNEKLQKIAKNIIAVGEWRQVDMVGLAEIENRYVLEELLRNTPLINEGYEIVHQESPDNRGIDVALLYKPGKNLKLVNWEALEVVFEGEDSRPTRDVLYAKFFALKKDTLHVFINHWPSRYGGQVATEPKRMRAAQTIVDKIEQLEKTDTSPSILISGDLNDAPEDISVKETLGARLKEDDLEEGDLFNLTAQFGWNIGTHKYQGEWSVLDHIIVSEALLKGKEKVQVLNKQAQIFSGPWLFEEDQTYQGDKPYRTYLGPRYHGGYSDHLPVYVDLVVAD